MTYPQIAAFARLANGNVAPTRSIAGQSTQLVRDSHDIFYDEVNDEIVVANAFGQAIMFYRGGANGEEPPVRVSEPDKGRRHSSALPRERTNPGKWRRLISERMFDESDNERLVKSVVSRDMGVGHMARALRDKERCRGGAQL